jgi:hypothetical protein
MTDMTTAIAVEFRELDRRINDQVEVALEWCAETNQIRIAVIDHKINSGQICVTVPNENALDAFEHPFAYLEEIREEVIS